MKILSRVKYILTLSCQSAAELSSRRLDEQLSLVDRLALNGHLLVCGGCRRFRKQVAFLSEATRHVAARLEEAADSGLSEEARVRIAQTMHDAQREL